MAHAVDLNAVTIGAKQPAQETASRAPIRWWLLPQILSLDAVVVAVAWQWLFAREFHVRIAPAVLFVTAACVWMIYAADHLLDVRAGAIYSARHRFMDRNARAFLVAAVTVFATGAIVSTRLPLSIWRGAVELTMIVGIYLALVHWGGARVRRWWPKEFVIGAVFAAGSSIATWSSGAVPRPVWPGVALFAALCALNCCAADCWEWQANHVLTRYPHRATRWVAAHFMGCAGFLVLLGTLLMVWEPSRIIAAVVLSTGLLMILAAQRNSFSPEIARLLADAALLTPLLLLFR